MIEFVTSVLNLIAAVISLAAIILTAIKRKNK